MTTRSVLDRFLDDRNEAARVLIRGAATERFLDAGDRILVRNEFPGRLGLISAGLFRVELHDRHGKPVEVARLGPGDLLGELSFLTGDPVATDVIAETDASVWSIDHAVLTAASDLDPTLIRDLATLVAGRVRSTNQRLRQAHLGRVAVIKARPRALEVGAIHRLARAAAFHNQGPVLLLDLAQADPLPAPGARFEGVGDLPADRSLLAALGEFASRGSVDVAYTAAGRHEVSLDAVGVLVSQLRRRFTTILVLVDLEDRCLEAIEDDIDVTLGLIVEGDDAAGVERCVVLCESPAQPYQRDKIAASRAHGTSVDPVIPGPTEALLPARIDEALSTEAQAELERVARILVGRTVGLALGAGGSKGYAHIGARVALREMGVPIDFIAGCSVAAPLAGGMSVDYDAETMQRAMTTMLRQAARPTLPYRSLLSSRGLDNGLREFTGDQTFEDARIPLAVVAADIERREVVTFTEGPVHGPMLASAAIPILFPPIEVDGRHLVDGGVLQPIPIRQVAELGADIVIAVKLNDPTEPPDAVPPSRFSVRRLRLPVIDAVLDTISVMQWQVFSDSDAQADITVEPHFEGPTGLRDYARGPYFTQCGADAVEAVRDQIEQYLPWVRLSRGTNR